MDTRSEPLISIDEAAAHLGVSAKTVRRMISRGDLKAVRIGPRLIRIDAASLASAGRPLTVARADR